MAVSLVITGVTFPDNSTQTTAATGFGFKNRIINGAMAINQRGSSSYTSNGYTLDRWTIFNSGGTFALSQQTYAQGSQPASGIKNFMRVTRASPASILYITQKIEDVALYDNITMTLSFYAKATGAITLPSRVAQEFGSGGSSAVAVGTTNHSITTTLQKFTATYSVPSLSGKTIGTSSYLECTFDMPATTETLEISGVQFEIGSTATSFDYRPFQTELALAQRYCYQVTSVGGTDGFVRYAVGECVNTVVMDSVIPLPVQMRITPSLTTPAASQFAATASPIAGTAISLLAGSGVNTAGVRLTVASGLTTGRAAQLMSNNNNTSYLLFSSEL